MFFFFFSDLADNQTPWLLHVSRRPSLCCSSIATTGTDCPGVGRPAEKIRTEITDLFKINHPIMLAGMNVAAGPRLAAAVTNAGGLGVLGGINYTPDMLRDQIEELKSHLVDKNAPFGVDLLLPQVGGNARKTKCVPSYYIHLTTILLLLLPLPLPLPPSLSRGHG